jgi:DNA-binding response OmpR family regulator
MMSPAPLRDEVVRGLEAEGYSVRIADRSEDPAAIPPAEFPDLLVIAAEAGQGDASAVASAWTAGATRPRAVVLIETLRAVDRLRASAAGIDAAFSEEQAAGALPPYARALARVGAPPRAVLVVGAEAERVESLAAPLEEAFGRYDASRPARCVTSWSGKCPTSCWRARRSAMPTSRRLPSW